MMLSQNDHVTNRLVLFRSAVVCPIIDVISDNDFAYLTGSDMTWVC